MTDKLTEALAWYPGPLSGLAKTDEEVAVLDTYEEAAQRWAEFPTDDDVETAVRAMNDWQDQQTAALEDADWSNRGLMRAALEAVKREDR